MIIVTSETIPGQRIVKTLGIVRGNTVRARHVGKDIMAGLRNLVGGEIHEYAKLTAESREQSIDRMVAEAESLGANAVIATRFTTSMIAQGLLSCWRSARPSLSKRTSTFSLARRARLKRQCTGAAAEFYHHDRGWRNATHTGCPRSLFCHW